MIRAWWPGWLGLAGAPAILVEGYGAAVSPVPYSFLKQAISDLGSTGCGPVERYPSGPVEVCSPGHPVVNAVWVLTGLILAVWAGARWWRRRPPRVVTIGLGLVAVAGLLQAVVGLVPTDVELVVHSLAALVGIVAQNLALVLAAGLIPSTTGRRVSVGAGVVGLAATALLAAPTAWGLPFGLVERIAVYPFLVWTGVLGVWWARRGVNPDRSG